MGVFTRFRRRKSVAGEEPSETAPQHAAGTEAEPASTGDGDGDGDGDEDSAAGQVDIPKQASAEDAADNAETAPGAEDTPAAESAAEPGGASADAEHATGSDSGKSA